VQGTDGPVGSVAGLMIHGRDWKIRELVINPLPGIGDQEIFLLPETVDRINYGEATVYLNLAHNEVRQLTGGPAVSA
jgi:hypothetical protein